MKVSRKTKEDVFVKDVNFGEVFCEDGRLFLRCRYEDEELECDVCNASMDINDYVDCLAVDLINGGIYNFEPHACVTIVDCEVIEK